MTRTAPQLFDLTDRVAVITGGAGTLGMQHAAAIAEAGGHAVIADISDATVRSAAALTAAHGIEAFGVRLDIRRPAEVEAMVGAVMEKFGRIDILINNAALTIRGGSHVPPSISRPSNSIRWTSGSRRWR